MWSRVYAALAAVAVLAALAAAPSCRCAPGRAPAGNSAAGGRGARPDPDVPRDRHAAAGDAQAGPVGRSERVPGRGDVARRPRIPRRHRGAVVGRVARRRRPAEPPDRLHVRRRLPRVVHKRAADPAGAGMARVDGARALTPRRAPVRAAGWPAPYAWKLQPYMVREMLADGWELDSHSLTHPMLTTVSATQLHAEVYASRAELQAQFGVPVSVFCYPYGGYDAATVKAVEGAGYVAALSTNLGLASSRQSPYALDRIPVDRGEGVAGIRPCCAATACRSRSSHSSRLRCSGAPLRRRRAPGSARRHARGGRDSRPRPACDPGREPARDRALPGRRRPRPGGGADDRARRRLRRARAVRPLVRGGRAGAAAAAADAVGAGGGDAAVRRPRTGRGRGGGRGGAGRPSAADVRAARDAGPGARTRQGVRWPAPVAFADATLHVEECGLVRSDPGGDGSRYTWLAAFALVRVSLPGAGSAPATRAPRTRGRRSSPAPARRPGRCSRPRRATAAPPGASHVSSASRCSPAACSGARGSPGAISRPWSGSRTRSISSHAGAAGSGSATKSWITNLPPGASTRAISSRARAGRAGGGAS